MIFVEFVTMLVVVGIAGSLVAVGVLVSDVREATSSHHLHYFEEDTHGGCGW